MPFTPEEIDKKAGQLKAAGAPDEEIKNFVNLSFDEINKSATTPPPQSPPQKESPGFVQGIVQDIAKPFARFGASVAEMEKETFKNTFQGSSEAKKYREEAMTKGYDLGYFGNAKPWGAEQEEQIKTEGITGGEAAKRVVAQQISDGLQIASWFVGMGEAGAAEKVGAGALKEGGLSVMEEAGKKALAKKTLWEKTLNMVKGTIPFSVLQGLSAGSEGIAKGKGAGDSAWDATKTFAGNVVGLSLFNGASGILRLAGGKILESEVFAKGNIAMADLFKKITGLSSDEAANPKVAEELLSEVEQGHKDIVKGVSESMKTGQNFDTFKEIIREKFDKGIKAFNNKREELFGKFYDDTARIHIGEKPETDRLISQIDKHLGTSTKGKEVNLKELTPETEEHRNKVAELLSSSGAKKSPLSQAISSVKETFSKSLVSPKDIVELRDKISGMKHGITGTERTFLNQFDATLSNDVRTFLKSNPETAQFAKDYVLAQETSDYARNYLFKGPIKAMSMASGSMHEILASLSQNGAKMSTVTKEALLDALGGKGSGEQKQMSEAVFNEVLDIAQKLHAEPNEQAKILRKFTDEWTNSGIVDAKHINALNSMAELMSEKTGQFIDKVRTLGGEAKMKEGDVYHGTKAPIASLKEADVLQYGKPEALYGQGLYLTDNPTVAKGYSITKGAGKEGKILSGRIKPDVNLLNLDESLKPEVSKIMEGIANIDNYGTPFSFEGKNGQQAMKEFMNSLDGLPKYEAQEIVESLHSSLENLGYDGFRHTGGQITGGVPSNVSILWDGGKRRLQDKIQESLAPLGKELEQKAVTQESKEQTLHFVKTFQKAAGGAPLYVERANGTLDISNFKNALEKADGGTGMFNELISNLEKINPEAMKKGEFKNAIINSGLGTILLSTGHTWWGAGMLQKGLRGAMGSSGKLSAIDAADMVAKLAGEFDEKGQPYLTPGLIVGLLSDKYTIVTKTMKVLQKITQQQFGRGLKGEE